MLLFIGCAVMASDATYHPGMWEARALTVEAGIDEALVAWDAGDDAEAAKTVQMVYEGSFEPELEPALRELVGPRESVELELRFGLLRCAMEGRDRARIVAIGAEIVEPLKVHAAELDGMRAVIR
ncbi:MAG TPA: hypothetical protein QGF58_26170 [Myxococcota bacterium]|nr:hypothetical protein [Myxococcota bacterium]